MNEIEEYGKKERGFFNKGKKLLILAAEGAKKAYKWYDELDKFVLPEEDIIFEDELTNGVINKYSRMLEIYNRRHLENTYSRMQESRENVERILEPLQNKTIEAIDLVKAYESLLDINISSVLVNQQIMNNLSSELINNYNNVLLYIINTYCINKSSREYNCVSEKDEETFIRLIENEIKINTLKKDEIIELQNQMHLIFPRYKKILLRKKGYEIGVAAGLGVIAGIFFSPAVILGLAVGTTFKNEINDAVNKISGNETDDEIIKKFNIMLDNYMILVNDIYVNDVLENYKKIQKVLIKFRDKHVAITKHVIYEFASDKDKIEDLGVQIGRQINIYLEV